MSKLADTIEHYMKRLIDASPAACIVLQRKEMARQFNCAPSQINYVLSTRFTPERGFLVESRRGGGGYLCIRRIDLGKNRVATLLDILRELADKGISFQEASGFIEFLAEARVVTRREAHLMKAAVSFKPNRSPAESAARERAAILAGMLEALLREL